MIGLDLTEQLVIVSGGDGALGQAICARLAEMGAVVVSVDVGARTDFDARAAVGHYKADVSEVSQVEHMLDTLREQLGRLPTSA